MGEEGICEESLIVGEEMSSTVKMNVREGKREFANWSGNDGWIDSTGICDKELSGIECSVLIGEEVFYE